MARPGPKARPVIDRLMDKVKVVASGCWEFQGCKLANGYGKIALTRSKPVFAHRVSYEHAYGPIPDDLYVLHSCDNPSCVNPEHLSLGTAKDNWLDARSKGRNFASPQVTPNYRYVNHYSVSRHNEKSTVEMNRNG